MLLIVPPQSLAVKPPPQVPKTLSALMSPGHPDPSLLVLQEPVDPSGSRYIRSRVGLASATYRLPCASTASPVGALRLAGVALPLQLFAAKSPPQVPKTRRAVVAVVSLTFWGLSYSTTAAGSASETYKAPFLGSNATLCGSLRVVAVPDSGVQSFSTKLPQVPNTRSAINAPDWGPLAGLNP